jgi:hypothetical protein
VRIWRFIKYSSFFLDAEYHAHKIRIATNPIVANTKKISDIEYGGRMCAKDISPKKSRISVKTMHAIVIARIYLGRSPKAKLRHEIL